MKSSGKYKIIYSDDSKRDLENIGQYIASSLKNPAAATRIVMRIMDDVSRLRDFAHIGSPLWEIAAGGKDYRCMTVENYRVFYRTAGDIVYVVRILYGRRDYMRALFEFPAENTESDEQSKE